jgi:hypothetical protein
MIESLKANQSCIFLHFSRELYRLCNTIQTSEPGIMQPPTNNTIWQSLWSNFLRDIWHGDPFWQNFLSNFFASLIVGVIVAVLLPGFLERMQKQKVKAQMKGVVESFSNEQSLLCFAVWNTGKISFLSREIYWHIFVDENLKPEHPDNSEIGSAKIGDRNFFHYKGMLESPAFPSIPTDCFQLKIQKNTDKKGEVLYVLSTAHGIFPRSTKMSKDGNIDLKTIDSIPISDS